MKWAFTSTLKSSASSYTKLWLLLLNITLPLFVSFSLYSSACSQLFLHVRFRSPDASWSQLNQTNYSVNGDIMYLFPTIKMVKHWGSLPRDIQNVHIEFSMWREIENGKSRFTYKLPKKVSFHPRIEEHGCNITITNVRINIIMHRGSSNSEDFSETKCCRH